MAEAGTEVGDLATLAARFGAELRRAGLSVGPDRLERFARAVTTVRPTTTRELRGCALATLVSGPEQIAAFDRVFTDVFGGLSDPADERGDQNAPPLPWATRKRTAPTAVSADPTPQSGTQAGDRDDRESSYRAVASGLERLRTRDFAALTEDELRLLVDVMRALRLVTPPRRSRRLRPDRHGHRVDLRTTLRAARRTGGDPVNVARRTRSDRPRRLVVLCDVSGSMEPYARAMLQLLYCAAGGSRAEVFTFATRLTRVTPVLARSTPEAALRRAGRAVPDWSGGTRIGSALAEFNDRYGRRGMARNAVVLVISDGWDTGDPAVLGEQMRKLSRVAYRIVWANPRTQSTSFRPLAGGMAAALPYCDAVVSAHSLHALDELTSALGRA